MELAGEGAKGAGERVGGLHGEVTRRCWEGDVRDKAEQRFEAEAGVLAWWWCLTRRGVWPRYEYSKYRHYPTENTCYLGILGMAVTVNASN